MWKKYINTITKNKNIKDYKTYCLWFANHFSFRIYSLHELFNTIEKENGDLLPISKNLTTFFHSANIEVFINIIYHINELDNLDFIIMKSESKDNFSYLFNHININHYFCNVFSFDYELLLSNNNSKATILYLFLFFLPGHNISDSLFHSRKKIPLICCNKITLEHFNMLLFLMKIYDKDNFNILCKGYNLNCILLEDFCQNSTEIYVVTEKEDWNHLLPVEKMTLLFKEHCTFINFEDYRKEKLFYTAPSLIEYIQFFQKKLEYITLKNKLDLKAQLVIKNKVIKI